MHSHGTEAKHLDRILPSNLSNVAILYFKINRTQNYGFYLLEYLCTVIIGEANMIPDIWIDDIIDTKPGIVN